MVFEKSLLDLVKGLRSHKHNETEYINQCLAEIKNEVQSNDHFLKAVAILKMAHLYMLGYDISFGYFHCVEVMSQPWFGHKRMAYLCASLAFGPDTDVILLTTHLFKRAFQQSSGASRTKSAAGPADDVQYEAGCAINCLANIVTPSLAETLLEDLYGMLNSSRPYIRKKSTLVLYAIFRKFPRALRLSFDRLREKLADEDPGVQNAAVNVICELARKNPKNYLGLLPRFFELLNNSGNNWMLIKLVKLLGALIPAEPRLARKLQEPLTNIITNTPAKSLLYECINTATNCEKMSNSMIRLCLDKLRTFVEDPDQNLKYLGLLGLNKIMAKNAKGVAQHRDLILQCLDDLDVTIRMRALDLITNMVNRRNLEAIIERLTEHLYSTDGNYREHVLERIIEICGKENFENVEDFQWYIRLLTNLTQLQSMSGTNAQLICTQLMEVAIRVAGVREFAVRQMEGLIVNNGLIGDAHNMSSNAICRVLYAAAFICGEYSEFVTEHLTLVRAMLQARISSLPGDIQCVFIQNALKVVHSGTMMIVENDADNSLITDLIFGACQLLESLSESSHIEVQERANCYLYFMKYLNDQIDTRPETIENQIIAFGEFVSTAGDKKELNPVHKNAQKRAAEKIPAGLDLETWIGEPWPESEDDDDNDGLGSGDDWHIGSESDDVMYPSDFEDSDHARREGYLDSKESEDGDHRRKKHRKRRSKKSQASTQWKDRTFILDADGANNPDQLSRSDIDQIPIAEAPPTVTEDEPRMKVFPERTRRGKNRKKYTVNTAVMRVKGMNHDDSDDDNGDADVDDPLKNMSLDGANDEDMPRLQAYKHVNAATVETPSSPQNGDDAAMNGDKREKGKRKKKSRSSREERKKKRRDEKRKRRKRKDEPDEDLSGFVADVLEPMEKEKSKGRRDRNGFGRKKDKGEKKRKGKKKKDKRNGGDVVHDSGVGGTDDFLGDFLMDSMQPSASTGDVEEVVQEEKRADPSRSAPRKKKKKGKREKKQKKSSSSRKEQPMEQEDLLGLF